MVLKKALKDRWEKETAQGAAGEPTAGGETENAWTAPAEMPAFARIQANVYVDGDRRFA